VSLTMYRFVTGIFFFYMKRHQLIEIFPVSNLVCIEYPSKS
jgi:hypothetical protein